MEELYVRLSLSNGENIAGEFEAESITAGIEMVEQSRKTSLVFRGKMHQRCLCVDSGAVVFFEVGKRHETTELRFEPRAKY